MDLPPTPRRGGKYRHRCKYEPCSRQFRTADITDWYCCPEHRREHHKGRVYQSITLTPEEEARSTAALNRIEGHRRFRKARPGRRTMGMGIIYGRAPKDKLKGKA